MELKDDVSSLPQYGLGKVLWIWAAAAIPMGILGWVAAPLAKRPPLSQDGENTRPLMVVARPDRRPDGRLPNAGRRDIQQALDFPVPVFCGAARIFARRRSRCARSQVANGGGVGRLGSLYPFGRVQYVLGGRAPVPWVVAAPDGRGVRKMGLGGQRIVIRRLSPSPTLGLRRLRRLRDV